MTPTELPPARSVPVTRAELPPARSVLVTGSSGLIGRRVVARLGAGAHEVETLVALDRLDVASADRLPGVHYVTGDVRDPSLADLMVDHGVDTVVHLAAVVTPGGDSTRELEYSIDVGGSENVLAGARRAGVSQLVYASSGAAYGYHADNPVPLTEDDPLRGNPEFAYSDHKRLVEEMLAAHRQAHPELAQLIFRPGTILGEAAANPITAIFERPVVVGVAGEDIPFVLIWDEDVAAAISLGICERRTGIFNLAGDGAVTLREIARRIGKPYVPLPAGLLEGALWSARGLRLSRAGPEQVRFLRHRPVLSNRRLVEEFGFTPSMTSEQCFERYRRVRFGP